MMFEIKILDTRKTTLDELLQKYEALPVSRKEKVDKLQNESQKVVAIEAYHLVIQMLGLNTFPEFETTKFGKPYISGERQFNISHSKGVIVVAISDEPVGVDIEKQKEFSDSLSSRIFSIEEQKIAKETNNLNKEFLKLWVQKESLIKLEGKTIATNLKTVLKNKNNYNFTFFEYEDFEICVCQKK